MILGVSEAPQDVSFAAMAERQQALARVILKDPAGAEPVVLHRHRRHEHDAQQRPHPDQPEAAGRAAGRRRRRHPPPAARARRSTGITLFMQPVQDLTVEDRVSRTQFQYTPRGPRRARSSLTWSRASSRGCRRCPSFRDVASDQQSVGTQARVRASTAPRPRASASRPRCSTTRCTTPSASARSRPCSRSSTSTASCWRRGRASSGPRRPADDVYVRVAARRAGAAERLHRASSTAPRRSPSTTRASSRSSRSRSTSRRGASLGDAVARHRASAKAELGLPAEHPGRLPGHGRRRSGPRWPTRRCSSSPPLVTGLHPARRPLRELHPSRSRSCPRFRRPAWARSSR